jgi:hypothetical protein
MNAAAPLHCYRLVRCYRSSLHKFDTWGARASRPLPSASRRRSVETNFCDTTLEFPRFFLRAKWGEISPKEQFPHRTHESVRIGPSPSLPHNCGGEGRGEVAPFSMGVYGEAEREACSVGNSAGTHPLRPLCHFQILSRGSFGVAWFQVNARNPTSQTAG